MLSKNQSESIKSTEEFVPDNLAILGHYEGECADSNITNLNGLDITREVWENVFNSDEYKRALEHGWYIGFLGHPTDDAGGPDCQDFRKACIVMRKGWIDDAGKVHGKFDLINTPVGQIVKAFQDAGVVFGISVRGAGDIIQNSVDPDTFVFRGFDLVTFPAFPKSIPEFIAASSDPSKRKQYQAVCSAVATNIDVLDTVSAVETVQACFAKQSDEYKMLEDRKRQLMSSADPVEIVQEIPEDKDVVLAEDVPAETDLPVSPEIDEVEFEVDPRVDAVTRLYLEEKEKTRALLQENEALRAQIDTIIAENARKMSSVERICSSQIRDLNATLETVEASLKTEKSKRKQITSRSKYLEDELDKVQASLKSASETSRDLRRDCRDLSHEVSSLKAENLKYITKVESSTAEIEHKDSIIASMKLQLAETVSKSDSEASSNRDAEIAALNSKIQAAESIIQEYQAAYLKMYSNALGVRQPSLSITANTSVAGLQRMIRSSVSIPAKPDIMLPTQDVEPSDFEVQDCDDTDLVTL